MAGTVVQFDAVIGAGKAGLDDVGMVGHGADSSVSWTASVGERTGRRKPVAGTARCSDARDLARAAGSGRIRAPDVPAAQGPAPAR
jgi:hypothetical protein